MSSKVQPHLMKTLISLGLDQEMAYLYLTLMPIGKANLSDISRKVGYGRTKTRRLLNDLVELNLVGVDENQTGNVYSTKSYSNLQNLLEKKEAELRSNKKNLTELRELFEEEGEKGNKITRYYGIDGLKQVVWNSTKAKNVLKVFELSRLNMFLDYGFSEEVRLEYLKNQVYSKDLTNERFIQGWTNVEEYAEKYSEYRFLDPEELEINFEIYIYNNTVTLLEYRNEEIFCMEIESAPLKMMMNQMFDYIWERSPAHKKTGKKGEMSVDA